MKRFGRMMVWMLLFTLVVNPVLFESRVWAAGTTSTSTGTTGSSKVSTSQTQVKEGDKKVQDMEEVKLSWSDKIGLGIGSWCKGKSWNYYKGKVDEANKKIAEAKGQSTKSKDRTEQSQKAGTQASGMKSNIQSTASAKATYQQCLMDTGNDLVKIAGLLKIIGLALVVIGACTTEIFGIGVAIGTIGTYLGYIASALETAGNSIIKSAQAGASGDSVWAGAVTGAVKGYISAEAKGGPSAQSAASQLGVALGGDSTLSQAIGIGVGALTGNSGTSANTGTSGKTAPTGTAGTTTPANYVETPSTPVPGDPNYNYANPQTPSNYVEKNPAPAQTGQGTPGTEEPPAAADPGAGDMSPTGSTDRSVDPSYNNDFTLPGRTTDPSLNNDFTLPPKEPGSGE